MISFIITLVLSIGVFVVIIYQQRKYFIDTRNNRKVFESFFDKDSDYSTVVIDYDGESYPKICPVGKTGSDLNSLIEEINVYLYKTKGTSDYEFIRNKVERKLSMRYDQAAVHQSFPTYLGLMGTFVGVFVGILCFLLGFDGTGNISDNSIRNLLIGVLISMSTSFIGLILTTINTAKSGEARKKVEDAKNEFYDFIQTEVTKTASASLVSAISKLHDTVDKFEPAFNGVINRFQTTFDTCTKAFGDNFEKNVVAVAGAVQMMGQNMNKINDNISLQKQMLETIKSSDMVRSLEKYIAAADHFVSITQSLNKFEKARQMMLAAAQESISIQNAYAESLKIPREVAVRINDILDRVKDFEKAVNEVGHNLERRDIMGNDVLNKIDDQIKGIAKKGKIADRYLGIADGKLEDLFEAQTKAIGAMNNRYQDALQKHIDGFERMLTENAEELKLRHDQFMEDLGSKYDLSTFMEDLAQLRKIDDIVSQLDKLKNGVQDPVRFSELILKLKGISEDIGKLEKTTAKITTNAKPATEDKKGGIFGWGAK